MRTGSITDPAVEVNVVAEAWVSAFERIILLEFAAQSGPHVANVVASPEPCRNRNLKPLSQLTKHPLEDSARCRRQRRWSRSHAQVGRANSVYVACRFETERTVVDCPSVKSATLESAATKRGAQSLKEDFVVGRNYQLMIAKFILYELRRTGAMICIN